MRLLLDECVPRGLAPLLAPHDVETVQGAGWPGIKNGQLLALCATRFDCLPTVDRNLAYQQDVKALPVAVLIIDCRSNALPALFPLLPAIHQALGQLQPRTITRVGDVDAMPTPGGVSEWEGLTAGYLLAAR